MNICFRPRTVAYGAGAELFLPAGFRFYGLKNV